MIYLASSSPRRIELLTLMGVRFELLLPGADEDAEALEERQGDEPPLSYVKRVTLLKLAAAQTRIAARSMPSGLVLCADTTVSIEGQIFGKPADADAARSTLQSLSNRSHRVITGVAVGLPGGKPRYAASTSQVVFAELSASMIEHYIATGEPFGKAGAYAIQGGGGELVKSIRGSASGIVGLPMWETRQLLNRAGYKGTDGEL
jgi:septum formation protein